MSARSAGRSVAASASRSASSSSIAAERSSSRPRSAIEPSQVGAQRRHPPRHPLRALLVVPQIGVGGLGLELAELGPHRRPARAPPRSSRASPRAPCSSSAGSTLDTLSEVTRGRRRQLAACDRRGRACRCPETGTAPPSLAMPSHGATGRTGTLHLTAHRHRDRAARRRSCPGGSSRRECPRQVGASLLDRLARHRRGTTRVQRQASPQRKSGPS